MEMLFLKIGKGEIMFNDILEDIAIYSGEFIADRKNTDSRIVMTMLKKSSSEEKNVSVKSEATNVPVLISAGEKINFVYKVSGITAEQAQQINTIDMKIQIKDRMNRIKELGGSLQYVDMNHQGFKRNLIMVDSSMPQIIGNMLLYYYEEEVKDCNKLVEIAGQRDPLGYGDSMMYEYKFKKFLCSCALGMKPAKKWDGLDEANGGYIIVKADGEILAYHIYNRNFFEQYLLDNTVFERDSASSDEYISLYEQDGEMFIKLNLQVRFR